MYPRRRGRRGYPLPAEPAPPARSGGLSGLRGLVNGWVLLGAAAVGLALLGVTAGLVWLARPARSQPAPPTAMLNVIPFPTATPTMPPPTPLPTPTETPAVQLPPGPGGVITAGAYVQITGTGGDGLRLRAEPGLESEVLFLALEAEVFQVADGPRSAGGFTWWYLQAPADPARKGWAVANYLAVVQAP